MLMFLSSQPPIKKKFDQVLEELINGLVIEGFYIEDVDVHLLPSGYSNITGLSGHVCNNAQFNVLVNNVIIGRVNLNNNGVGYAFPYNDEENTPAPLTDGVWNGMSVARYSRIDISSENATEILENTNSTSVSIEIVPLASSPHSDITWLRISINKDNVLTPVIDLLAEMNTPYLVDLAS